MPAFEETVAGELRSFLVHEVLDGNGGELDEDTSLLTSGIVNSRVIMKLLSFVETNYGVRLPFKVLNAENLQTVRSIAKMVVVFSSQQD